MLPFELHVPTSLDEGLDLLDQFGDDARPIAGGTALTLLMQQRLVLPGHLVSLGRIAELSGIDASDGSLRIGAATTHRTLEMDAGARAGWPLLTETYHRVATVRIRNVATVGGGLAHADPNQDPPAALICLDATVGVASKGGRRDIPVDELFTGYYETALQPGEIVTHVTMPRPQRPPRTAYLKFLPRTADDYATVAVGVALDMEDGRCHDARVALVAAGPTPIRARAAEDVLRGNIVTPELMREAAATVPPIVDPISDHRGSANYKRRMAEVFVRRALEAALA